MPVMDVRFDGVSKKYRVRQPASSAGLRYQDFWAVRDVTLDIPHGETLGIIGRNGAGKSTLLKLLSRITSPTAGTIELRGRLAALIEVGSGFHPELTGRENVFLSGSVLGMKRREIAAKLDRIVDFSGVRPFIDMPVKWYSSGMYVRLGFAVAAHLEADILLVDEVLAVGDAAFQIQCYERIGELRRGGTTMVFISHDLGSIERLCDRVVLMNRGRVTDIGAPAEVLGHYHQLVAESFAADTAGASVVAEAGAARVCDVRFVDDAGLDVPGTATGGRLRTVVEIDVTVPIAEAVVEVFYYSRDGRTLHCQQSTATTDAAVVLMPGRRRLEFVCDGFGLQPGIYSVGASIRDRHTPVTIDWWYGTRLLHVKPGKSVRGYFYAPHQWRWADAPDGQRRPAV